MDSRLRCVSEIFSIAWILRSMIKSGRSLFWSGLKSRIRTDSKRSIVTGSESYPETIGLEFDSWIGLSQARSIAALGETAGRPTEGTTHWGLARELPGDWQPPGLQAAMHSSCHATNYKLRPVHGYVETHDVNCNLKRYVQGHVAMSVQLGYWGFLIYLLRVYTVEHGQTEPTMLGDGKPRSGAVLNKHKLVF